MRIEPVEISMAVGRRLALKHQGLWNADPFGKGQKAVLQAIRHLGYVQIDTISVVERAHHHVLWSRIPGYQPEWLDQLQQERFIFEYWSHAASYLPMEDYRFCLPRMLRLREAEKHWFPREKSEMQRVLDRISSEGPLMSRDFEGTPGSGDRWDLKPVKYAIHEMVQMGKLMVSKRVGFQKAYDLPENCIPGHVDVSVPTESEMAQHLILRAIMAHGLMDLSGISYQRKGIRPALQNQVKAMLKDGQLREVKLMGQNYLTLKDTPLELPRKPRQTKVFLLSPFDNTVIQRQRLADVFNFDFRTEIYVPEAKRKYGYFSMPVLWGDRFVGRLDPKAHRKTKTLEIKNFQIESDFTPSPPFWEQLRVALEAFCRFNKCERIQGDAWPELSGICTNETG